MDGQFAGLPWRQASGCHFQGFTEGLGPHRGGTPVGGSGVGVGHNDDILDICLVILNI